MRNRGRSGMNRRHFLALAAAAAAMPAVARAAQPPPRRMGGTFISAKTTEVPSLDTILEQAASRQRIDVLFYNRLVQWASDAQSSRRWPNPGPPARTGRLGRSNCAAVRSFTMGASCPRTT